MKQQKNQPFSSHPEPHKVSVTHTQVYQGQLPPPEMLQQFNAIDSTFANRIVSMAEKEQQNRHENESRFTKNLVRMSLLGITCAFLSVLIMSGLVYYSLSKGYSQAASAIAVGAIAAVASVFIFFRRRIKPE
jgi:uncharacterized membrane protein